MDLDLEKELLESVVKEALDWISDMETQETDDGFGWNKEQLSEIKETAELLAERVNKLECQDLKEAENYCKGGNND